MFFYQPYILAAVFAVISASRGQNPKSKAFWYEIGTSCALMLILRDILMKIGYA